MSNLNLNKVLLGGRMCADPELKQTTSGVPVVSFRIAVNRRFAGVDGKTQADFITIVAWRQTAEFVARYFRRGSSICVSGALQSHSWTDAQGKKGYAVEVVADEVYFVGKKADAAPREGAPSAAEGAPYIPASYLGAGEGDIMGDEDLPF